jgi:hypothetical protein
MSTIARIALLFIATCALAALWPAASAHAQGPRVATAVDRARVEIGEEIELTIQADGRYEELEMPSTDDFDVVGQRFTQINRRVSRTWVLRPRKAGSYTIGAARLKLQGKVVAESEPIVITVTEPVAAAPVEAAAAGDLSTLEKEAVFVRWATERGRYVVGEPFVMALELWTAAGIVSRQAELVKAAKHEGLLVEDLPRNDQVQPQRRTIGNAVFQVVPLMTAIATPLKPGRVLIDATTVRLAIAEDDWAMVARTVTRSTQPYWLEIIDVPTEGRPNAFAAANVGQFDVKVSLRDDRSQEPKQARTGQRLVLRAEVSGRGNLGGLQAPEVTHDGTWEVSLLPGQNEDRVVRDAAGIRGQRVFQWLVVPREPGRRSAPSVVMSWFDPVAQTFSKREATGAMLEVTGESSVAAANDASQLGEDVGPIFTDATLSDARTDTFAVSPIYWGALGGVFLLFAWVEFRARRAVKDARDPGARAARQALANARKRLRTAERAAKDGLSRDVHAHLARALTAFLEERSNIPAGGLTHDALRQAMARANYPQALIEALLVEIEHCEFARFAPGESNPQKTRESIERIEALLVKLDGVPSRRLP